MQQVELSMLGVESSVQGVELGLLHFIIALQLANGTLLRVDNLQCHVEVELIILFMCCHISPLQLRIAPNTSILA
jgi:hypothetical protein